MSFNYSNDCVVSMEGHELDTAKGRSKVYIEN